MSFDLISLPDIDVSGNGLQGISQEDPSDNPAVLYLLTLGTEQSRVRVRRLLNSVAASFGYSDMLSCPWEQMRAKHILQLKAVMEKQKKAPSTINLIVSILKGVAKQAWSLGKLGDHDQAVILSLKGSRGSRNQVKGRALEQLETEQLLSVCKSDKHNAHGIRDALVIALGVGCGLRRTEIAELKLSGIERTQGLIRIIGKGNKLRHVFPPKQVWELIDQWLALRGKDGCDTLFCAVRKGDHIHPEEPITGNGVYQILSRRGKASGVADFSPHDMRRTFATRLIESGADLNIVRQAMGHSSILTTQRYDKRDEEAIRKYAEDIRL